ncbi:MAG: PrgI family protein [Candidatus Bipolaricaulota bacterium]|nr:PrgI family protein [Candidatus Bipolaricaulota bacterium]
MSASSSKSLLDFLAEMGDLLAKYATKSDYAIAMVVIGLIFWPVGAVIAGLLIASIYARSQRAVSTEPGSSELAQPTAPVKTENSKKKEEREWLIVGGLVLIGWGAYLLAKDYLKVDIPWAVILVVAGVFLIWLAYARYQGGASPS